MHTYRKTDDGKWQAGHNDGKSFMPLGPAFVDQCWAAAFASFLNGGRFSPGEIELIFGTDRSPDEDDDSTYPHPQGMDYEPEAARK